MAGGRTRLSIRPRAGLLQRSRLKDRGDCAATVGVSIGAVDRALRFRPRDARVEIVPNSTGWLVAGGAETRRPQKIDGAEGAVRQCVIGNVHVSPCR